MKKNLFSVGYCASLILCCLLIDHKYGDLPFRAWSVMLLLALILGRLGKKLEKWLINTYMFFGVVVLVLLLCFEELYKVMVDLL